MSEMEIEIGYNIVSDEEYKEILKICSKTMIELFINSLKKEQNDYKE